jgi:hypothetical protein
MANISGFLSKLPATPQQTAQHLDTVQNIPVAYLHWDGDDLAEILLQISSASDERVREIKLALNEPS